VAEHFTSAAAVYLCGSVGKEKKVYGVLVRSHVRRGKKRDLQGFRWR
jgi:hypothetical protein